ALRVAGVRPAAEHAPGGPGPGVREAPRGRRRRPGAEAQRARPDPAAARRPGADREQDRPPALPHHPGPGRPRPPGRVAAGHRSGGRGPDPQAEGAVVSKVEFHPDSGLPMIEQAGVWRVLAALPGLASYAALAPWASARPVLPRSQWRPTGRRHRAK